MCFRVAKHFQDSRARVQIVGFPDAGSPSAARFGKCAHWNFEGVDVFELRRGFIQNALLQLAPDLKRRRATFSLARACFEAAYSRQMTSLCQGSDVFHYFGTGMEMNGYAVAKAAKSLGAKFFVEPAIHEGTWGDSWLDVPLYVQADGLIAHTAYEGRLLEKMGIPQMRIHPIVHGFDFCDTGDGPRFRNKHRISGPMVLFFGRKTKKKGISRLLEAWPLVAEKHPRATLVLAGSSIWKDDKIESFKLQHQNLEIRDLDDISEDEKQDALAACDVLCVPSEGESFGMVYFEAWAYKKPVVALDLPVFEESIREIGGGLLTQPQPELIAESLLKLLGNSEMRMKMGEKGYKLSQEHDWPRAIKSYLKAYHLEGLFLK